MISFNWDIHLACNYKCPYCWWHGKEEEINKKNFYVNIDKVIDAWSEEEDTFIGNIFDVDFKMLEEASICNCYKCVENEWAFLLEKEDNK